MTTSSGILSPAKTWILRESADDPHREPTIIWPTRHNVMRPIAKIHSFQGLSWEVKYRCSGWGEESIRRMGKYEAQHCVVFEGTSATERVLADFV